MANASGPQRERWEYFWFEATRDSLLKFDPHINSYGREGWEAVGVVRDETDGMFSILMKRRIVE